MCAKYVNRIVLGVILLGCNFAFGAPTKKEKCEAKSAYKNQKVLAYQGGEDDICREKFKYRQLDGLAEAVIVQKSAASHKKVHKNTTKKFFGWWEDGVLTGAFITVGDYEGDDHISAVTLEFRAQLPDRVVEWSFQGIRPLDQEAIRGRTYGENIYAWILSPGSVDPFGKSLPRGDYDRASTDDLLAMAAAMAKQLEVKTASVDELRAFLKKIPIADVERQSLLPTLVADATWFEPDRLRSRWLEEYERTKAANDRYIQAIDERQKAAAAERERKDHEDAEKIRAFGGALLGVLSAGADAYASHQSLTQPNVTEPSEEQPTPTYASSKDELIASLKDKARPECVEYRSNRFFNVCNFDIEILFCINNPAPFDKAPLTDAGAAYDCAKKQYGLWTIGMGEAMTGTFTGESSSYTACKKPYSPVDVGGPGENVGHFTYYACK